MSILFQMVMEFIAGIREEKARLTAIKKKKKYNTVRSKPKKKKCLQVEHKQSLYSMISIPD